MRMYHFRAQDVPFVLNKVFLVQTITITFIYLLTFLLHKILKKFYSESRVMRMPHFWAQNGPFDHSYLTISPFHCVKFLKNSSIGSRVMRMGNFSSQNGPFPQMRVFSENLLMSLVSFIHAYLHAKNQSQILIY